MARKRFAGRGFISEAISIVRGEDPPFAGISQTIRDFGPDPLIDYGVDDQEPAEFSDDVEVGPGAIAEAIQAETARLKAEQERDELLQAEFEESGPTQQELLEREFRIGQQERAEHMEAFFKHLEHLTDLGAGGVKTGAFSDLELAAEFAEWDRRGLRKRGKITTNPIRSHR